MAFTLISRARHSLSPTHTGWTSNDAAGFASCYGPLSRFPHRGFRHWASTRPFPPDAASLLPGLLAATRTGLPPAGNDELTNTRLTYCSTMNLLFRWAHERGRLTPNPTHQAQGLTVKARGPTNGPVSPSRTAQWSFALLRILLTA